MTIQHVGDAAPFAFAPGRTRTLAATDHLMLVVVDFDDGPASVADVPHTHPHEQVTYVVEGEFLLNVDGQIHHMRPGDLASIPANVPHGIQTLTPHVRAIDAFTPLRKDFQTP